jgi:hypothetical protein
VSAALALSALVANGPGRAAEPRFFPDDPIERDHDRALDASGAKPVETGNYYDFVEHTFFTPGERRDIRAVNVNTLGEVPDSSWFTNRLGRRPMSIEEIVRGPDRVPTLSVDGWPIVRDKGTGLQAGFRLADPTGHIYQIEFDPVSNPEMATGAEMIGTAFYYAFGYSVVDVYLVEFDPEKSVIAPDATIKDITGKRRRMTRADVDEVMRRAARLPNGRYRALASRFADGVPLGSFRYSGTRTDDPNDIFLHEHRRELRGNRVFCAWLNHDDSRGLNSLDMLDQTGDRRTVTHYMFDFGSILGSGTDFAQVPRASNEYILDWGEGFRTLATLGVYARPWLLIHYPDVAPSVGRFEAEKFDPEGWKPEYPNPAFDNLQADDAFWAARIISFFTEDIVRAVVAKGRYSDPKAAEYIVQTLMKRRQKVLTVWLNQVLPIEDVRLDAAGTLTWGNAAVRAGVASPATAYRLVWSRFDNAADSHTPVGTEVAVEGTRAEAPKELLSGSEYIAVRIRGSSAEHPRWLLRPAQVYFRRDGAGWKTVGIDRAPEMPVLTLEKSTVR